MRGQVLEKSGVPSPIGRLAACSRSRGPFYFCEQEPSRITAAGMAAHCGFTGKRPIAKPGRRVCERPSGLHGNGTGLSRTESQCLACAGLTPEPWSRWAG